MIMNQWTEWGTLFSYKPIVAILGMVCGIGFSSLPHQTEWYWMIFIYIYLSSVVGNPNFSGQEKPQETSLKWAELLEKAMDREMVNMMVHIDNLDECMRGSQCKMGRNTPLGLAIIYIYIVPLGNSCIKSRGLSSKNRFFYIGVSLCGWASLGRVVIL